MCMLKCLIALIVLAAGVGLLTLKLRYGGGQSYPDVGTAPVARQQALETLVSSPYPPGNVAVASDGRVLFNYRLFAVAQRIVPSTVFELVGSEMKPFPYAAFRSRYPIRTEDPDLRPLLHARARESGLHGKHIARTDLPHTLSKLQPATHSNKNVAKDDA